MTILTLQPDATAGIDTSIVDNANFNYGISGELQVGNVGAADWRSLLQFDLSSIPANAVITSAIITLYVTAEVSATDYTVDIHRGLVQWYEGLKDNAAPSPGEDGSTWLYRNYNGSIAWGANGGLAGTDYVSAASASVSITGPLTTFDFNVLSDVQNIVSGGVTNYGWWLLPATAASSTKKNFASSDNSTAANRPQLVVNYTVLESSVSGSSSITGTLFATGYLVSNLTGLATVNATLISNEFIQSSVQGTSTVSGELAAPGYMQSSIASSSGVSGDIFGQQQVVSTIAGLSVVSGHLIGIFDLQSSIAGSSQVTATGEFQGQLRGQIIGSSTVVAIGYARAIRVAGIIGCNPVPLLYLTDGSVKPNGQLNIVNFLSQHSGYSLKTGGWRPKISQYKEGGRFSSSLNSQGRRLKAREFDNSIEVFELSASAFDQDALIDYQQELLAFQEAAADYWVSDYVIYPYYLVARAARETNTRYAIVHMMSVPELENPYQQPFFSNDRVAFETLTIRIERGHWLSKPPGQFDCVAISSQRSWTVSGWQVGV